MGDPEVKAAQVLNTLAEKQDFSGATVAILKMDHCCECCGTYLLTG